MSNFQLVTSLKLRQILPIDVSDISKHSLKHYGHPFLFILKIFIHYFISKNPLYYNYLYFLHKETQSKDICGSRT